VTTTLAPDTVGVPVSHQDLLTRPICGVFTTIGGDGQPESSLVWVDFEDGFAQINTTLERRKGRNMLTNPRVSLLIVDPENTTRFIQIRGDVELIEEGAIAHLDRVTRAYTRRPRFYGFVYPTDRQARQTRVICRIHARRITLDAIHS
jgi:PPOX class probable F420-dependent enzyme